MIDNRALSFNRIRTLISALATIGIKPGATLTQLDESINALNALDKAVGTANGNNKLTQDVTELIRAGNPDKALAALKDEAMLKSALLEMVWSENRRGIVAEQVARDIEAHAPTVTDEELPKIAQAFKTKVADPMHAGAEILPFDLDPATILQDNNKVQAWRKVEEAKNAYEQFTHVLETLTSLGGYVNAAGRDRSILKRSKYSTFEDAQDYRNAVAGGGSYPWAVVHNNGQLGINDGEQTIEAYKVASVPAQLPTMKFN